MTRANKTTQRFTGAAWRAVQHMGACGFGMESVSGNLRPLGYPCLFALDIRTEGVASTA